MFRDRLDRSVSEFGESSKKTSRLAAVSVGRYTFLIELAFALMATLGLWWTWHGETSLFVYLMFIIVSKEFYKPFVNMESHWLNYIKVKDSYGRISRLLDAPVIVNPDQPKTAEQRPSVAIRAKANSIRKVYPLLGTAGWLYPYRRRGDSGNGL